MFVMYQPSSQTAQTDEQNIELPDRPSVIQTMMTFRKRFLIAGTGVRNLNGAGWLIELSDRIFLFLPVAKSV